VRSESFRGSTNGPLDASYRGDFTAASTEENMVVRTRTQLGLRVAFYRADVLTDTEVARTEEDARDSALAIIGRLDFLQAGDRLEVTEV
jgi:hypothetical protein